jgi:hypothetical protein
MRHIRRSGGIAPQFLTSALDGGQWSASRLEPFILEEIAPGTLDRPRTGLDTMQERKILLCRESNMGLPARSPSLCPLNYPDS